MRELFHLLFLACLVPLLCCLDLVRLPTSRFQFALLSVRRGFLAAVGNGGIVRKNFLKKWATTSKPAN